MYIMSSAQPTSTQPNPYSQTPVENIDTFNFVLEQFTSSINLLEAQMQAGESPVQYDVSATGVFNIDIEDAKKIFRFSSNDWDISNNIPIGSLHYYLDASKWPTTLTLNPANAMMDQIGLGPSAGAITHNNKDRQELLIKHDFIRYLALRLFNTPLGADLFSNQSEMLNDLTAKGELHWQNDISANLWKYDVTTSTLEEDGVQFIIDGSSNQFCTTDNYTANDNITRELFQQIVKAQRSRFENVTLDQFNQAPIPFIHGDSISYKFTINPAANQETLTGVPSFGARVYRIQLNIFDSTIIPIYNTVPKYA
jgi:hypothetical protein